MLSFILECGNSTVGSNAACALRIRVSMSEIGSVIIFSCPRRLPKRRARELLIYQLAFVTPGINPFSAASRNVKREAENFRR